MSNTARKADWCADDFEMMTYQYRAFEQLRLSTVSCSLLSATRRVMGCTTIATALALWTAAERGQRVIVVASGRNIAFMLQKIRVDIGRQRPAFNEPIVVRCGAGGGIITFISDRALGSCHGLSACDTLIVDGLRSDADAAGRIVHPALESGKTNVVVVVGFSPHRTGWHAMFDVIPERCKQRVLLSDDARGDRTKAMVVNY